MLWLAAVGVPASVAVPLPLSTKVTPGGRAPTFVIEGTGLPLVSTSKLPGTFTEKVALAGVVNAGDWCTNSVTVCVASGATPFAAVTENE